MMSALLLSVAVSFLSILFFLLSFWKNQKKYHFLPPGPAPLPFLGNLNFFVYNHFPELQKKYGPIFTIWRSTEPVIVLCGYEVVKDALVNHAEEFSNRPTFPVFDRCFKGYSFPNSNGERWRQLRRFTIATLKNVGMGKMSMEKQVLQESELLIKAVTLTGGKPFNAINLLSCAVGNIITSTLLGEHFHYEDPTFQELIVNIRKFNFIFHSPLFELTNTFPVLLNVPFLKEKFMKESSLLRSFVKKYMDQHKKSLNPKSPRDFIDYYLIKIKEEETILGSNFFELSLVLTVIALLTAGTETMNTTLNFLLLIISHYSDVQAKVQQEIDEVTGSQRPPGISDRAQMPYTNAVIHEAQRVLDLAPLAHYHAVTKDTQFRGYTIPKGTIVIPFLSSVLSDPTQWETPEDFNPGHFLDDEGNFQQKSAFMVFSAGKRICPGEAMARMEVFLLFSALLQNFTFTLPPGTERQDCRKLKENKFKTLFFSQICAQPRAGSSAA